MSTTDWLGFIGVSLILVAYFLAEINKISNKDLTFILLNLTGSLLACFASILLKYVPFIILEGAWALISLGSLVNYVRLKALISKTNCTPLKIVIAIIITIKQHSFFVLILKNIGEINVIKHNVFTYQTWPIGKAMIALDGLI